jgi:hypothetical protein
MDSESSPIDCSSSKASKDTAGQYPDADKADFITKEKYFYRSIYKFIKQLSINDLKMIVAMIDGKSDISFRLMDWFVTKRSERKVVVIKHGGNGMDDTNVHVGYKSQLKSYKKKYFDPFKRHRKFYYTFIIEGKPHKCLTTIGQLNFLKWAYEYEIIKYVRDNYDALTAEFKEDNDKKEELNNVDDIKDIDSIKKSDKDIASKHSQSSKSNQIKSNELEQHKPNKDHVIIKKKSTTITAKQIKSTSQEKKIVLSFE